MTLYTSYQQFTARRFMKISFLAIFILSIVALDSVPAFAQNPAPVIDERTAAGDEPDDPGRLATDLSPSLKRPAILKAMKKVADWQVQHSEGRYNIQWTFAALYDGLLAASSTTGDRRYHERVLQVARENHWELGPRFAHADDEAVGLTYLAFYAEDHKADEIARTRESWINCLPGPTIHKNSSGGGAMLFIWRRRCWPSCLWRLAIAATSTS